MKTGLIFDMDGTLWDSASRVAEAWTLGLREQGIPDRIITTEDMYNLMGKTMNAIADILFPELPQPSRRELLGYCCQVENRVIREQGGELYPQLEETLRELKERYHLYIVSNCHAGYIEAFLDFYHLWDLFEDIECFGNTGLPKGQSIRLLYNCNHLERAAYVGDIQGDCDSAAEAGIPFIHAAYGFGKIDHTVPTIQTFPELLTVAPQVL